MIPQQSHSLPTWKQQKIRIDTSCCYDHQKNTLKFTGQYYRDTLFDILHNQKWHSIKELSICSCLIDDRKLGVVFGFGWPELMVLDLQNNMVTGQGVEIITRAKLGNIQSINFSGNQISDTGTHTILMRQYPNLKNLNLSTNNITYKGLRTILSVNLRNLKNLFLSNNPIGLPGVKLLVKGNIPNLRSLYLNCCGLGREGLVVIGKGRWMELNQLNIQKNTDVFKQATVGSYGWTNLENIYLGIAPFEPRSVLQQASISSCQKIYLNLNIKNTTFKNTLLNILTNIVIDQY